MVDAVNKIGGGVAFAPAVQQPAVTPAPAVDTTAAKTTSTAAQAPISSSSSNESNALSGRFYDDPLAGILVSQQLDSQGQVVQQTPSSSVLAYLRNGLTIEGYPKDSKTA